MSTPFQVQAGNFMARMVDDQWQFFYCYRRDARGAQWRAIGGRPKWRKAVVRRFWRVMVGIAAGGAA